MKNTFLLCCLATLSFIACKTENKQKTATETTPEKELNILEKVAYAHGFEHWKAVKEIAFTFNVDREGNPHYQRSWVWDTKENKVTAITDKDTLTYFRKDMDSIATKTNGGFINDKFWLMAPYNLIWDRDNITYTLTPEAVAPISEKKMQKLTIVYGNEGGYTPGDAYDFFFGDDYIIQEWNFRKGNQEEPSMSTTWQDYLETKGLKIATAHKNKEGNFTLSFTGVEVK